MIQKEEYTGIDYFRIIAALLIVAIHTSPLTSMNETADFILTRILARVAVPFFFMATGFFLLPRYINTKDSDPNYFYKFLKSTIKLYAIAILIYLPVNFYTGYFRTKSIIPTLLKDIVFDGTFYHLWYLPSVILGVGILFVLLKKIKSNGVFIITMLLYVIGLFGDSYYGIVKQRWFFEQFYNGLFSFSNYTRNGLFFAPIFLMMGGLIAKQKPMSHVKTYLLGLVISLILLLNEGLMLHHFSIQRHDSMYFMLLPTMYFFFRLLLLWRGKSHKNMRTISMIIYIIHPFSIILIRGLAKITHMQQILIDNSAVHYLAAAACSSISAVILAILFNKSKKTKFVKDRAWIELNLDNLKHNVRALQNPLPMKCQFMAVLKANAYGHGDIAVAKELNKIGISAFAVAALDEGIQLRKHGVKGIILILGYTSPERFHDLVRYHLMQTVVDYEYANILDKFGRKVEVHIKIDTGMHRLGENYENILNIDQIFRCKNLKISGIYTHLCVSDHCEESDIDFTNKQIEHFYDLLKEIANFGHTIPKIHIQSSYGVLNFPELQCDYARIGIALYGVLSSAHDQTKTTIDLRPVLSLKARIAATKDLMAGDTIGYGRQFTAPQNCRIAVVSIGYADGFPRNLSNGCSYVLINGQRAPIIGSVCMDLLMVDITHIPDVKQSDIVTLIGNDHMEKISAEQVAENSGTIANELLSRLGNRLRRVYFHNS